jgi:hypothetical protein
MIPDFSANSREKTIEKLNAEIAMLKLQLEKVHNQRGAGRKSKITPEMTAEVRKLRQKNIRDYGGL